MNKIKQVKCRVYQISSVEKNKMTGIESKVGGPVLLHQVVIEGHTLKVTFEERYEGDKGSNPAYISGGRAHYIEGIACAHA